MARSAGKAGSRASLGAAMDWVHWKSYSRLICYRNTVTSVVGGGKRQGRARCPQRSMQAATVSCRRPLVHDSVVSFKSPASLLLCPTMSNENDPPVMVVEICIEVHGLTWFNFIGVAAQGRGGRRTECPARVTNDRPPACSGLSLLMQNIDYGTAAAGFPLGEREKAAVQQGSERTAQNGGQGATVATLRRCRPAPPPRRRATQ